MQAARRLETAVATKLGVAQVYTLKEHIAQTSYREFLERVAAAASSQGPACGGRLQKVSLCVKPDYEMAMQQQQQQVSNMPRHCQKVG